MPVAAPRDGNADDNSRLPQVKSKFCLRLFISNMLSNQNVQRHRRDTTIRLRHQPVPAHVVMCSGSTARKLQHTSENKAFSRK
ncbi:hypothetical protein UPYG_G00032360 [Umbra pygmaea]|uniref:Uncharacterized protein n=1 Tax=Umbra pygmaea TaxID=75934 RepID=A0ABD0Y1N7_UMBPY